MNFDGRTADGFWWARVVVIQSPTPFRYCVEIYERVFPAGTNAKWEPRLGEEGFPLFDNPSSANTAARMWLARHEPPHPRVRRHGA